MVLPSQGVILLLLHHPYITIHNKPYFTHHFVYLDERRSTKVSLKTHFHSPFSQKSSEHCWTGACKVLSCLSVCSWLRTLYEILGNSISYIYLH